MTNVYDSLEAKIYGISAGDEKLIQWYKGLTHLYFNDDKEFDDLPDSLKLVIAEWENENLEEEQYKHREAPLYEVE